jgi:hypothetical protein
VHPSVPDGASDDGSALASIGQSKGIALAATGERLLVAIWTLIRSSAQPRSGSKAIRRMMNRGFTLGTYKATNGTAAIAFPCWLAVYRTRGVPPSTRDLGRVATRGARSRVSATGRQAESLFATLSSWCSHFPRPVARLAAWVETFLVPGPNGPLIAHGSPSINHTCN